MKPDALRESERLGLSPAIRTVVSLLLIVHLFLAAVAMSANLAPAYSSFQRRILSVFACYTQLFGVDLNFTPFYWTHATLEDVDHRIEVLVEGRQAERDQDWIVLPDAGLRGSDRYHRYQRLGRVWGLLSQRDDLTATLAQGVGSSFREQRGIQPRRVRCRRHMLQGWEVSRSGTNAQRNPDDPSYFQVAYDANLVISRNGDVSVVKIAEAREIAQPAARDGAKDGSNQ